MNHPLSACSLSGTISRKTGDFAALGASLLYQAGALGIACETHQEPVSENLVFDFKTPKTSPIHCQISRWADPGLLKPATENTLQAACGIMSVHGRASGKVQALGVDYISTLTAVLALQGGVAGAIGQLRGLSVKDSHVSMAAAGLLAMGQYVAGATAEEMPEKLLPDMIDHPRCPPFISRDGKAFELETLSPEPWQKFWAKVGISSTLAGKGWNAFLLRYAKAMSPVPAEMIEALAAIDYKQICAVADEIGIAVCPVRSLAQRACDGDAEAAWRQGPWGFEFASTGVQAMGRASGELPLSGITVIESCRRIQGPLAGHMLALLGADVIRLEPPGGDPLRGMPPMAEGCSARFDALNRLKTIREVDIKSQQGKEEIYHLINSADVFLHNWAPDKAAELKLDYPDFKRINPALIYAYASGWTTTGAVNNGLKSMPGTDFMTQAYSGVADKIAANSGTRGGSLFTVLDVLGGVVAAQGVTVALLNRCLNHAAANVSSSLLSSASLLMAADLDRHYQGQMSDKRFNLNAVLPTRQGKIAIECTDANQAERLARLLGVEAYDDDGDLLAALADALTAESAEAWCEVFTEAGIAASVVVEDLSALQADPRFQTQLKTGAYTQVTSPWRFQ